jgi:hypothetical protein
MQPYHAGDMSRFLRFAVIANKDALERLHGVLEVQ